MEAAAMLFKHFLWALMKIYNLDASSQMRLWYVNGHSPKLYGINLEDIAV